MPVKNVKSQEDGAEPKNLKVIARFEIKNSNIATAHRSRWKPKIQTEKKPRNKHPTIESNKNIKN